MISRTEKPWKIVLGALCACIVVLVVAIVAINLNRGESADDDADRITSLHTPEFDKINEEIIDMSFEEACAVYEEAIENAATDLAREQAIVEYGIYLMNCGRSNESLNRLLNLDADILDAGYKILLYATLRDYFYSIENDELGSAYNDMIRETTIGSKYAVGG